MDATKKNAIVRHSKYIIENIDAAPIMDSLQQSGVFATSEVSKISKIGVHDQEINRQMLSALYKKAEGKKPFENFIDALNNNEEKETAGKILEIYEGLLDGRAGSHGSQGASSSTADKMTPEQMNAVCKQALEDCRTVFLNNISGVAEILNYLRSVGIVGDLDAAEINDATPRPYKQIELLLRIIKSKEHAAFEEFMKSLLYYKCGHNVTEINKRLMELGHKTINVDATLKALRPLDPIALKKQPLIYN